METDLQVAAARTTTSPPPQTHRPRGGLTSAGEAAYRQRAHRLAAPAAPTPTRAGHGPRDAAGGVAALGLRRQAAASPAAKLRRRTITQRLLGPATTAITVSAVVGLVLRLAVVSRPLDVLDRMFIPDDTYYTLSIARSLAHGLGPTMDAGAPLTNGFQPLVAFLETPVFWFIDSPDTGVRVALVLLALCDTITVVWLGRIAHRLGGPLAAGVAALVWALSPLAIAQAAGGLEAALSTMLAVALVDTWMTVRHRPTTGGWVLCGAVAGLGVLARIDVLLLVALLVVGELTRARTRADLRHLVPASVGAAITLGPWWVYSLATFGSPIPASGTAVRRLVELHHLSAGQEAGWGVGTVITAPFLLLRPLRAALFLNSDVGLVAFIVVVLLALVAAVVLARRGRRGDPRRVAAVLPLFAAGLLGFYSLYLGALWFDTRYLSPVNAVATLLVALAAAALWPRRRRRAAAVGVGVFGLALLASVVGDVRDLVIAPSSTVDIGYDGAKGYREAATETIAAAPPGAIVGSLQSGALTYYAGDRIQVINLDGVVDSDAASALAAHHLAAYAASRGVRYFADWPFNLNVLLATSTGTTLTPSDFRVEHAAQQGPDAFTLWQLTTPAPAITP